MSISDTQLAKKYASIAEVAAAQAKLNALISEGAEGYAEAALASANSASSSANSAAQTVDVVSGLASAASVSALDAANSAASAGSAAADAIGSTVRAPAGEILTELPVANERALNVMVFDGVGDSAVKPIDEFAIIGENGKIPVSVIPSIALTQPFVVSSQEEMLALDVQVGDIAKRTDLGYSFCLSAEPPTSLSNWIQLTDDVLSQLGQSSGASQVGALAPNGSSSDVQTMLSSLNTSMATKVSTAGLAAVDGAKLSLSQIATAYGLDFSMGGVWVEGTPSTADNWWWYNNKVYTGIAGALPTVPTANMYQLPPFAKRGFVSVKDFGAIGSRTTTEDDAPAFAAAIAYLKSIGGGTLLIPTGIYDVYSPISLVGVRIKLQGSGRDMTNIRAAAAMDRVIDIGEIRSSDQANLPCHVCDLGVIGASLANYCIYHADRHNMYVESCQFSGALVANLYALRTWLSGYTNCGFAGGNGDNVYLAGTNHRMEFSRCNFGSTKANKYCVRIVNDDSLDADGVTTVTNEYSKALVFNNCDIEYTDISGGRGIFVNALEVAFNNCYIGEFVLGTVMDVVRGLVNINNGIFYYGATSASIGINASGGTTRFKGVLIRPHDTLAQMYIDTLVSGSSGKVSFQDINITRDDISGATVPDILHNKQLPGDLLLTIASPTGSFVPRMGSQYTAQSVDATITNSSGTDGSRVFAVTAVGTTATHQAAFIASILNKLSAPGALLLAVVYQSNVSLPVIIESSAFSGGGTQIGTLPSTSNAKKTYFLVYSTDSSALPAGNVIRIGGDVVVGSSATLYKVTLTDSLSFNGNAGSKSYKSIGLF